MSEFVFPTDGEWLDEYRRWLWKKDESEKWDPDTILLHVSRIFREHLSLPARLDYYAPERAALVLGALLGKPPAIKHGALAFAAWMVRQKDRHVLTSAVGADILQGMRQLQAELEIPDSVDSVMKEFLDKYGYLSELHPSAGGIVRLWLKTVEKPIPLAAWLHELGSSR